MIDWPWWTSRRCSWISGGNGRWTFLVWSNSFCSSSSLQASSWKWLGQPKSLWMNPQKWLERRPDWDYTDDSFGFRCCLSASIWSSLFRNNRGLYGWARAPRTHLHNKEFLSQSWREEKHHGSHCHFLFVFLHHCLLSPVPKRQKIHHVSEGGAVRRRQDFNGNLYPLNADRRHRNRRCMKFCTPKNFLEPISAVKRQMNSKVLDFDKLSVIEWLQKFLALLVWKWQQCKYCYYSRTLLYRTRL